MAKVKFVFPVEVTLWVRKDIGKLAEVTVTVWSLQIDEGEPGEYIELTESDSIGKITIAGVNAVDMKVKVFVIVCGINYVVAQSEIRR